MKNSDPNKSFPKQFSKHVTASQPFLYDTLSVFRENISHQNDASFFIFIFPLLSEPIKGRQNEHFPPPVMIHQAEKFKVFFWGAHNLIQMKIFSGVKGDNLNYFQISTVELGSRNGESFSWLAVRVENRKFLRKNFDL
jgi:hypothetical protein